MILIAKYWVLLALQKGSEQTTFKNTTKHSHYLHKCGPLGVIYV